MAKSILELFAELTDPQEGELMTELKGSGRSTGPLWSQTVITDGDRGAGALEDLKSLFFVSKGLRRCYNAIVS